MAGFHSNQMLTRFTLEKRTRVNRCELMSSFLESLTLSNGSPQSMEKLAAIAFSSRMKAGEKADSLSVISLCACVCE